MDFDKENWSEDVDAVRETCRAIQIPASVERSRSGNSAHLWLFFKEPVPAVLAWKLGTYILTRTMERRPETAGKVRLNDHLPISFADRSQMEVDLCCRTARLAIDALGNSHGSAFCD